MEQVIAEYFDNPKLTKIQNDGESQTSLYMAKVSKIGLKTRYIVCNVPMDVYLVGEVFPLSQLKWVSFQTRSLEKSLHVHITSYQPKRGKLFSTPIQQTSESPESVTYQTNLFPQYQIILLKNSNTPFNYPPTGHLNTALETFECIIAKNS